MLKWADRLIATCATRIVPEGDGVKRDLLRFSVTRKPLKVIGHGNIAGVDTSYFSPDDDGVRTAGQRLAADLGLDRTNRVYCFVGRLNADKGLKELLEAFRELPSNARLVIVGASDESAPIDAATQTGLAGAGIHRLGFLDDVRPALAISDLLVLPSYREGFPNVILQAGAMGLPVLATDVSGCNEFITPGVNGWLVEPRNSGALLRAMREALALPKDQLEAMGAVGRRRVRERHERTDYWRSLQRFYEGEFALSVNQQPIPPAER